MVSLCRTIAGPNSAGIHDSFVGQPRSNPVGDTPFDGALVEVVRRELRPWRSGQRVAVARVPAGRKRSAVARQDLAEAESDGLPACLSLVGSVIEYDSCAPSASSEIVLCGNGGMEFTPLHTIDRNPSELMIFNDRIGICPGQWQPAQRCM